MVREDQVVIYKQYAAKGQFRIAAETAVALPAECNAGVEALELIFNPEDGRLVLVAKVGTSIDGQKAQVAFFSIDYTELFAEMTSSYSLMNFADTYRTKSHVILNLPDGETHLVLDPFSAQEPNIELYNRILAPSINDDFLFDFKASMVSATDLSAGRDRQPLVGVPEGQRPTDAQFVQLLMLSLLGMACFNSERMLRPRATVHCVATSPRARHTINHHRRLWALDAQVPSVPL